MENFMTTKEAAKLWTTSEAIVTNRCPGIQGAVCRGGRWFIPAGTAKPENVPVLSEVERALPLGIGGEDFKTFSNGAYYVDKTLLLKEIIDAGSGVFLFARPRRFGKSLNMDMIRTFFELTKEDNSAYFEDKKIWLCDKMYRDQQGKYPVIYLNFQTAKKNTWKQTYLQLCKLLKDEVKRYKDLSKSKVCGDDYKEMVKSFAAKGDDRYDFENTLLDLSKLLADHYGVPAIIIIDEYDTPIQQGYLKGFHQEVIQFLRNLFCGGLKGNKAVRYGIFAGILQVAKESIFSGLNNLQVYSVLDSKFSAYFGYTADEVRDMAVEYHAEDKMDEIRTWYNGYVFGGTEIYNPWSVANYFGRNCSVEEHWLNTSGNDLIGELIKTAHADTLDQLKDLLNRQTVRVAVDVRMVYPEIKNNPNSIFSFLLASGYLKALDNPPAKNGELCTLAIPNMEVLRIFQAEIIYRFVPGCQAIAKDIQKALENNDRQTVQKSLQSLLYKSASYFDTSAEGFYHGFVLGLSAAFAGYYVTSNRESGDGRYDIQMEPLSTDHPGILLEFKSLDKENYSEENLRREAVDALNQINRNHYDENLKNRNVHTIYKYGIAFCSKQVDVVSEGCSSEDSDAET